MSKYAPAREDGFYPYVRIQSSWGRTTTRIVWAENLSEAKHDHGWSPMKHTYVKVRRATPEDMPGGAA